MAARFLEDRGFTTVVLTPMPEFHNSVGIPRSAAIEYPFGRAVGQAGDREGQRRVLLKALAMLDDAQEPGEIRHLQFTWPEDPRETKWHPPEMSPIVKIYLDEIKAARKKIG